MCSTAYISNISLKKSCKQSGCCADLILEGKKFRYTYKILKFFHFSSATLLKLILENIRLDVVCLTT